jgi:hypothetical protein
MLWYKSWLETRWRFLIGLFVLLCSAAGSVALYPHVVKLTATMPVNMTGVLGEKVRESAQLAQSFRGYVWANWFRQNLAQMGTLLAILLGTASLLSESAGALFTLSLPVSRQRLLHVRAASGLAQLFAAILVPTLLVALAAPAIGQRYPVGDALVHALCFFVAATLFFSIAILLSTMFGDPWRPLMIAVGIAFGLALAGWFDVPALGVFEVMSGESWFRDGRLPWAGLLATAAVSASVYGGAVMNLARRDF